MIFTTAGLVYNLMMIAVDTAALACLGRRRTALTCLTAWLLAGAAAVVLAIVLGQGVFLVARLAAYGLFLHGTVVVAGSAVLLRRTRRKTTLGSAALAGMIVAVAVDAFLIEPTWLEVSHLRLDTPKLSRPVRLDVLADLQTDQFGPYERRVLRRVVNEKPNVILLAGDYLQAEPQQQAKLRSQINAFLHELDFGASARAFAVPGNIDGSDWAELFDGLGVITASSSESFRVGEIRLTCLGLADSRDTRLEIRREEADRFHLVMGHVPNFALGRIEADLLIAGHTHGGQVRLPGIGPLLTLCRVPRGWAAGLTELSGGGKLLVSRGVGMERDVAPRLRFLCRPELVVVDLVPDKQ